MKKTTVSVHIPKNIQGRWNKAYEIDIPSNDHLSLAWRKNANIILTNKRNHYFVDFCGAVKLLDKILDKYEALVDKKGEE